MARRRKDTHKKGRLRGKGTPLGRRLLWWALGTLGGLLLLAALGYGQLMAYLQGESFKSSLERTLTNRAQAESVQLAGTLGIDGGRISLPGADAQRAGFVSAFSANRILAEIDRPALFDHLLHVKKLTLAEGTLTLDAGSIGEELPPVRKSDLGFWAAFVPRQLTIDRVDCQEFDTMLRLGSKDIHLAGSSVSAKPLPQQGKGAWEVTLGNGKLNTNVPMLGNCTLKGATLSFGDKAVSLSQGRLMLSPGELIANALYEKDSKRWSGDLRVNRADMARLLKKDWKKRLTGKLYGRMAIEGDGKGLRQAEGTVSLQDGLLEALPILSELTIDGTQPYRTLRLEKATAHLSYPYADPARNIRRAWMLDQLDIRAAGGLLRVKGHVIVDEDGSLGGTLLIGLPQETATKLVPIGGELYKSLFNAEGDAGFVWLRMNLSGTLEAPQEDLSVRMKTLVGNLQQKAGELWDQFFPGAAKDAPKDEGKEDEGSAPAGQKKPEPSGNILQDTTNAAQDIIGGGIRSLF